MLDQSGLIAQLYDHVSNITVETADIKRFETEISLAYRIRAVEQKFLELFSQSKVSGTVHTCVGQEFTGVAIAQFLNQGDWVTSNHRCHGHYIAKTGDWKGLIDELLGLKSGVSGGIGSSQHLYNNEFISNGTQGSLLPVASGLGLSKKKAGSDSIVVSFIGEGTLGEGNVYETLNLSSIFNSPHLIVCENNYYSQTTPQVGSVAGSIQGRAEAFGWQYFESSTWDLNNLFAECDKAVSYVRDNSKPAFLKLDTYRLLAHSKGDDDRDRAEVERFENIDLLNQLSGHSDFSEKFKSIKSEIDEYTSSKLSEKKIYSYADYKTDQLPREVSTVSDSISNNATSMVKALNAAYRIILTEKDGIFIGEDIAEPYGGAFKVTKGFQSERPDQVYSTSISEAGLTGLAIGFSLDKQSAYAEIMFGDFIVNAMDQIVNNASKFHHMYGKQFSCGVTIRTPMGGRRGYGPTHSQSLDKFILGIDNTLVSAPTSLCDPMELILELENHECPKIILENKTDYSSFLFKEPEGVSLTKIGGPLGSIILQPHDTEVDVCVIAYGYVARMIADNYEEIFKKSDTVFNLICPQILHPLPISHLHTSIAASGRVLVVEESTAGYGWADGVIATIAKNYRGVSCSSVSSDPVPIPSNRDLELENQVSVGDIIRALRELCDSDD